MIYFIYNSNLESFHYISVFQALELFEPRYSFQSDLERIFQSYHIPNLRKMLLSLLITTNNGARKQKIDL